MTPTEFKTLRSTQGAQRPTAKRLGIGFRTLQRLEAGTYGNPIPVKYELAMLALSGGPRP